ncbi:hypothetical protein GQ55_7G071700 [Panicum hallii var. hallii]|uniref:Pectinesterase inhibitor domain-containing protein n=1 Tax=Panicum hallii var. hallii TaxID=1504633 RepID=A0A2T7CST3_9POAL|nr:hypothetical protein GQ55_7G071700 [Panicum hallii var. hallii]
MKIVVCAVLMLLVITNCTAETPPMMAAQMEHAAEHAGQAKAFAKCDKRYDPCSPGNRNPTYPRN